MSRSKQRVGESIDLELVKSSLAGLYYTSSHAVTTHALVYDSQLASIRLLTGTSIISQHLHSTSVNINHQMNIQAHVHIMKSQ